MSLVVASLGWIDSRRHAENMHVLVQPDCVIEKEEFNHELRCHLIEVDTLKTG